MFETVKVAAISLKPTPWDKPGNAEKMEVFIRQAARESPEVIVLPEGALEGYVVMAVIENPAKGRDLVALAEPIDGSYIARFQALARELGVCLCFGFAERIGQEAYNAAIFVDDKGDLCGTHHKTRLAEGYHSTWYFNRLGKQIRAFDTPLGRCGIMICNERWEPVIARTLVLDGAQFLLIPAYGDKQRRQNEAVLARGRENGVPIVEANVGMNLIISKGGIVGYKWGVDQITVAEIDIPVLPSCQSARASEQYYLAQQDLLMEQFRLRRQAGEDVAATYLPSVS